MFRPVRSIIKILPVIIVLAAAGWAFAPAAMDGDASIKQRTRVIDTKGEVTMDKCEPCHRNLNNLDNNPNLVNFNHPVHFKRGIRCVACHVVFPHQPGKTVMPTMDLCANCHRQSHGSQGKTAPGQCATCHPASFKLTPADHEVADFRGSGHEEAGKDTQKCLVCHDSQSCVDCHEREGVKLEEPPRWYGIWPVVKGKGEKIRIGEKVEMSACQPCHRDLQKWRNSKLVNFSHPPHFKRQIACEKCHDEWPHEPGNIKRPRMTACGQCHRLDHGNQGKLVNAESADVSRYCSLCHPADMNLRPDFHTAEFVGGDHKNWAKGDRGLCRLCHVQGFCDNCHQTDIPHGPDWLGEHGRAVVAVQDQGDNLYCFRCHKKEGPQAAYQKAPSCAKCHKAVVFPHPKPWAPQHGKTMNAVGLEVCETCHVKARFCDECHGGAPIPHPDDWLGRHRQFLQDNTTDACLRCHQRGQCEQCHSLHGVHNQHTIYKLEQRFF